MGVWGLLCGVSGGLGVFMGIWDLLWGLMGVWEGLMRVWGLLGGINGDSVPPMGGLWAPGGPRWGAGHSGPRVGGGSVGSVQRAVGGRGRQ